MQLFKSLLTITLPEPATLLGLALAGGAMAMLKRDRRRETA